jgi:putative peptidoglycan lipid II flippase
MRALALSLNVKERDRGLGPDIHDSGHQTPVSNVKTPWEQTSLSESGRTSVLIGLGIAAKVAVDLVIAASFGLGSGTDAFFVAYTVPLIVEAVIYPTCQSALVPIFVRWSHGGSASRDWRLFSSLFNVAALISAALFAAVFLGAEGLVVALAPGAQATRELALSLTRLLAFGILFVGPLGVMRAVLNSHRLFAAPAMLELVRGTVVLAVLWLGSRRLGLQAVALGFALASVVQFVFLAAVVVRKLGFGYRPVVEARVLRASRVGRLFVVPLTDYFVWQPVLVLERVIGSYLPVGSISAINYGRRLAGAVGVGLFSGLEAVTLPALAAHFANGRLALHRARATFIRAVRLAMVVGIPVAVSFWALRFSITQLVFERGLFSHQSTLLAAPVLGIYALSLPLFGYWLLFRSYLFASLQPTRVLALSGVSVATNVVLALSLWRPFGAQGVAAAYVGGLVINGLASLFIVEREMRILQRGVAGLAARVTVASGTLGAVQYCIVSASSELLGRVDGLSRAMVLVFSLALAGMVGVPLLLLVFGLIGVKEAGEALRHLRGT